MTATWLLPVALIPSTWDETLPQPLPPPPPSKAAGSESTSADPTTLPGIAKEAGPDAAWAEVERRAKEAAEEDKKAKDGKAKNGKPTSDRKKNFFRKSVKESVKDVNEQNKGKA